MILDPKLKEDLKTYLLKRMKSKQAPKVVIRAAYILSDAEVAALKKRIKLLEKATIVREKDESILAGCVIQFGSQVIDLSLNRELQTLEHILYETA